jgi:endonuclease I
MNKRTIKILSAFSLVFILASCGNSVISSAFSSSESNETSSAASSKADSSDSGSSQSSSESSAAVSSSSSASGSSASSDSTASSSSSSSQDSSSSSDSSSQSSSSSSVITYYSFSISEEDGGEVTGTPSGRYEEGTEISLEALPNDGFSFSGYYSDDTLVAADAHYDFTLTGDTALVAVFAALNYSATYSHFFVVKDFPNTLAAGTTALINGLAWTYTAPTKLLSSTSEQGLQIGSNSFPQLTPWIMSTNFPDGVVVESYTIYLCTNKSASAKYSIAFGSYNKTGTFGNNIFLTYSDSGLSIPASDFSLTLQATSNTAMYINLLSFTVSIPANVNFPIHSDQIVAKPVAPGTNSVPLTRYQAMTDPTSYYSQYNLALTGQDLVGELRTLVTAMTAWNYGDARYALQYTDEDPNHPGYDYGMWDGDDILATWDAGASWNREHVWCCAQMQLDGVNPRPDNGTISQATDLHNLRVACPQSNEFHSNKFFDETNTGNTLFPNLTSGLNGFHAYTGDFRGDVARDVFYMYVRYPGLVLDDAEDTSDPVSMGKLSELVAWNDEDPVDPFETQRNERIYEYQGNRNPFIDHPELANKIWPAVS